MDAEGALAVALGSRRSSADLAAGSSLRGHLDAVTLGAASATSTTGTSSALGSAGSLTVVVVDAETLAALRDGAALTGTDDLTLTAGSTDRSSADATRGTGPGRAVVLATVRTGARLGTGTALVLPGDLRLTADQEAAAASAASLVALTLATHDVWASSGRAVTTGGALSMRATGDSRTSSRAPGLGTSSAATTTLTALRTLRLFTDTLATGAGLAGSTALPTVAPSTLPLSSVAATIVRGSAGIDLPALPVRAGGPVDLVAISGGGSGAGSGGNGNGATPAPSASVVLAILPSRVRVAGTLQSEEDLLLQAGRGPPAVESSTSTAPTGSAAVTVISRPTTVELLAPATAGPGSTRTIIRATTAPVEVIDLPGSTAPQVPATAPEPPAGSVLVTAAIGGTVTAGRATLRFAPGSLPADAFVAIHAERRYVPGLHAVSLVYDLLAWDARTGAPITHFRTAPVLTIGVDGADGAAIWYLAPDGDLERMPTTTARGSLTAALPHFSQYLAGSPLDGIAGMIVPLLQQYVTDALSGPRTQVLPDLDLGVFVLASPTVTFSGITGSTGSYTVTVTLSGRVTIGFVDGARPVGGSAALTGTYTVADRGPRRRRPRAHPRRPGAHPRRRRHRARRQREPRAGRRRPRRHRHRGDRRAHRAERPGAAADRDLPRPARAGRPRRRLPGRRRHPLAHRSARRVRHRHRLVARAQRHRRRRHPRRHDRARHRRRAGRRGRDPRRRRAVADRHDAHRAARRPHPHPRGDRPRGGAQRRRHHGAHRLGRHRHPRRRRHRHQRHPHRDRDDRARLHAARPHRRTGLARRQQPPRRRPRPARRARSCEWSPPASRWPSARSGPSPGRSPSSARPARAAPRWSCSA